MQHLCQNCISSRRLIDDKAQKEDTKYVDSLHTLPLQYDYRDMWDIVCRWIPHASFLAFQVAISQKIPSG